MIVLSKKYNPIFFSKKRYFLITGGRGASKSFSISSLLVRLLYEAGHRVLFSRYTLTSAHISVIPEFTEKIGLVGAGQHFDIKQKQIINNQSGSEIIFSGIKTASKTQTANLKSIQGITTFILDEAEELTNEDDFDKIDLSIRTKGVQNRVILILNPTTVDHWIWARWFEHTHKYIDIDGEAVPVSTHPDVEHIHMTYLDNIVHLSESFLQNIQNVKENNRVKYIHKILGGWLERSEGAIYQNWIEGEFNPALPYCYGLDFGYFPDPLAMVKIAVDERAKIIYLDECIYKLELSNEALISELKQHIKRGNDMIVGDTNEARTTAEIRKAGYNIKKAIKPNVADNIKQILDYRIVVTERSTNIKKELRLYEWNDRKSSTPIGDWNHAMDAFRYGFNQLTSKKRSGIKKANR